MAQELPAITTTDRQKAQTALNGIFNARALGNERSQIARLTAALRSASAGERAAIMEGLAASATTNTAFVAVIADVVANLPQLAVVVGAELAVQNNSGVTAQVMAATTAVAPTAAASLVQAVTTSNPTLVQAALTYTQNNPQIITQAQNSVTIPNIAAAPPITQTVTVPPSPAQNSGSNAKG
jgi:hypothetical protein